MLQELARAHSEAGMTCLMWKKLEDEPAELRLAFQCIHKPLASDPSMKEIQLLDKTKCAQYQENAVHLCHLGYVDTPVVQSPFQTGLLSCAFLGLCSDQSNDRGRCRKCVLGKQSKNWYLHG